MVSNNRRVIQKGLAQCFLHCNFSKSAERRKKKVPIKPALVVHQSNFSAPLEELLPMFFYFSTKGTIRSLPVKRIRSYLHTAHCRLYIEETVTVTLKFHGIFY